MKAWDTSVTDPAGGQQRLVKALVATGTPVVVVAVRDPYDIAYLPGVRTYLATYSYSPVAIEAAARVITGEVAPDGHAAGRRARGRRPVAGPLPLRLRAHLVTRAASGRSRHDERRQPPAAARCCRARAGCPAPRGGGRAGRRRRAPTPGAATPGAAPAGRGRPPPGRPGRHPGADRLARSRWADLAGQRVGVVTNPTGILQDLRHVVDAMVDSGSVDVVAVFGPEHGFRGTAQAGDSEGNHVDPRTGVMVYDAYGATAEKLAGFYREARVETVVFDIQDVGARFYTYVWTMYAAMKAAVATGARFVVLDRPNPVGGAARGPMLRPGFTSGVGQLEIVQQHGLTVGELARLFDAEFLPADAGGRLDGAHRHPGQRVEPRARRSPAPG